MCSPFIAAIIDETPVPGLIQMARVTPQGCRLLEPAPAKASARARAGETTGGKYLTTAPRKNVCASQQCTSLPHSPSSVDIRKPRRASSQSHLGRAPLPLHPPQSQKANSEPRADWLATLHIPQSATICGPADSRRRCRRRRRRRRRSPRGLRKAAHGGGPHHCVAGYGRYLANAFSTSAAVA